MAFDIANFIQEDTQQKIMLVEAPVGTGKSLGSLIPSLAEIDITNSDRRIVYATATINLQSQLMNSEVPLLKHLGLLNKAILAKGKSHYYCHKRLLLNQGIFNEEELMALNNFYKDSKTGHKDELENNYGEFTEGKWKHIKLEATRSECRQCDIRNTCSTFDHRNRFQSSENDLIVTNHDQYIVSVINEIERNNRQSIVPTSPGILIIDEAHHFMENFLGQLEQSFTLRELFALKKNVPNDLHKDLSQVLSRIETYIEDNRKKLGDSLQGRYQINGALFQEISKISSIINESIDKYETQMQFGRDNNAVKIYFLDEWSNILDKFLNERYVKWIEYDNNKFSAISNSFPTDFKNMIEYIKRYNKIIIMSGTLTNEGDFASLLAQWRLKKNDVITSTYDTPFDYKSQAMIYVPKEITNPNDKCFLNDVLKQIKEILHITRGSSLILCTAKEQMNTLWKELQFTFDELGIESFIQGQSGVERLTKLFTEDERSVLIGSGSFFSGFSVPGASLRSVILTKLPFPVKDDPLLELIGQGYEDEFFEFIIYPEMIKKLNQAAGRLIRSIDDYGIFTITDPRIFTKNYGEKVIGMLRQQGYIITRSRDEVQEFVKNKNRKGSQANYRKYERKLININPSLFKKSSISKNKSKKTSATHSNKENPSEKVYGVTKKQRQFMKEVCKREGLRPITASKSKDLYKGLIDGLYYEWIDTHFVEENFPYRNEEERKKLKKIKGKERRTVMPYCSKWGCDGNCNVKYKIESYLKETYNATSVRLIERENSYCRVLVTPIEILEKEEFRPTND